MECASDGLPKHYYDVIENKHGEMDDMRADVYLELSRMDVQFSISITAETMCDYADINPLFSGEVSDFIQEWRKDHD